VLKQKGTVLLLLIAGIALLFVISVSFYAGQRYFKTKDKVANSVASELGVTRGENKASNPDSQASNWKTYTNEKFGYSINYPNTWKTSRLDGGSTENSPDVNFRKIDDPIPAPSGFSIAVIENNPQNLSLSKWMEQNPENNGYLLGTGKIKTSKINVNGIMWERVLDESISIVPSGHVAFGVSHNGRLYLFLNHVDTDEEILAFLSHFKFLSAVKEPLTVLESTKKTLPYLLPSGWKTVVSRDGRLEVGFDPTKNQLLSEEATRSGVSFTGIWSTDPGQVRNLGYRYSFTIKPYDGGSRHNFLYRELSFKPFGTNYDDTPNDNFEREYLVQGWPCLVMFGIDVSQWTQVWGVCPISSNEAISFNMDGDETVVEKVLRTVKLLR
jgi:hypothetical protein